MRVEHRASAQRLSGLAEVTAASNVGNVAKNFHDYNGALWSHEERKLTREPMEAIAVLRASAPDR